MPERPIDISTSDPLLLARAAYKKATDAERKADSALLATGELQGQIGGLTAEVASLREDMSFEQERTLNQLDRLTSDRAAADGPG